MRLTIVPIDNKVVVGGSAIAPLNLSTCGIPSDVWALQWYETEGEIEFNGRPKPANEEITVLPEWALACISVWEAWTPPVPQEQPITSET
jgi:hypothetical protein